MTASLKIDGRGAVYVEFIICFIPVFILFLGVVQLSFVASAKLVVQHAAVMGARSAIVVLEDDDPERYGEEGFGVIDYRGQSSAAHSNGGDGMRRVTEWFGGAGGWLGGLSDTERGGPRLREIRKAVTVPLSAISPQPAEIARWLGAGARPVFRPAVSEGSLADAVGSTPWQRFAAGLVYNRAAAVVTFHREPGSSEIFEGAFGPGDNVTLRVTYLFHCAVPLVSRFMCRRPLGLSGPEESARWLRDAAGDPAGLDAGALARMAGETEERLQQLEKDLDLFSRAESPALTMTLLLADARFARLTAEATMPSQGADYYRKRTDDDR